LHSTRTEPFGRTIHVQSPLAISGIGPRAFAAAGASAEAVAAAAVPDARAPAVAEAWCSDQARTAAAIGDSA
jgi:hypothetical protein